MLIRLCQFNSLGQQLLEPRVALCNTVVGRNAWLCLACAETMTGIVLFIEGPGLRLNVRSPICSMFKAAELLG